jgi:hypothetical protein
VDIQSFLGFINFYHRFIEGFAHIAHPLHALAKKDQVNHILIVHTAWKRTARTMPQVLFCLSWALMTNGILLASIARGLVKWREIILSMTKSSCPLSGVCKSDGTSWKVQGTGLRFLMIIGTWFTSPWRKIVTRPDGPSTCHALTFNW